MSRNAADTMNIDIHVDGSDTSDSGIGPPRKRHRAAETTNNTGSTGGTLGPSHHNGSTSVRGTTNNNTQTPNSRWVPINNTHRPNQTTAPAPSAPTNPLLNLTPDDYANGVLASVARSTDFNPHHPFSDIEHVAITALATFRRAFDSLPTAKHREWRAVREQLYPINDGPMLPFEQLLSQVRMSIDIIGHDLGTLTERVRRNPDVCAQEGEAFITQEALVDAIAAMHRLLGAPLIPGNALEMPRVGCSGPRVYMRRMSIAMAPIDQVVASHVWSMAAVDEREAVEQRAWTGLRFMVGSRSVRAQLAAVKRFRDEFSWAIRRMDNLTAFFDGGVDEGVEMEEYVGEEGGDDFLAEHLERVGWDQTKNLDSKIF